MSGRKRKLDPEATSPPPPKRLDRTVSPERVNVPNNRTTIGALPPELLSRIFEYVHEAGESTYIRPGKALGIKDRGMFGISHVCRRWREVILSLGALWASKVDVSGRAPELNQLVLERTGSHPLDISLQAISYPYARENLALWLLLCAKRIQTIDVLCVGERLSSTLVNFVSTSYPVLRHLEICLDDPQVDSDDSDDPDSDSEETDNVSVATLPILNAPALTSVTLYNSLLPWGANVFSQLTHLHINVDAPVSHLGQRPTHAQLCSVLPSMKRLIVLYLRNIFPDYAITREVATPIHLAPTCEEVKLKCSTFEDTFFEQDENFGCSQLAASLVLPETRIATPNRTALKVELSCMGNLESSLRVLAGPSRPSRALGLSTEEGMDCGSVVVGLDASAWLSSPVELLGYVLPARLVNMNITFHAEPPVDVEPSEWEPEFFWDQYDEVTDALPKIDYSEVRVLRIDELRPGDRESLFNSRSGDVLYDMTDGAPILTRAKDVQTLILSDASNVDKLFKALATASVTTNEPLFPRLHTIAIRYPRRGRGDIVDSLRIRRAIGFPVAKLHVLQEKNHVDRWEDVQEFMEMEIHHPTLQ